MNSKKLSTSGKARDSINSNTPIGEVGKIFDVDAGVRKDMKYGTYLKKIGYPSLARLIDRVNGND